jgi:pre-mRNA-splicing factor 38A
MANVTDPLVSQLSGTDPQNLMEYITRQKIYDARYWKEECFGLSVVNVLEKSAQTLQCIGGLPCHFLSLVLKLLQLHPEHDIVQKAFIEQDTFKYTRALGCLYVRLTSRPTEIYESLEPLLQDRRKLRVWTGIGQNRWTTTTVDQFVYDLLQTTSSRTSVSSSISYLGITIPRLPSRRILQESGYLPDGPRIASSSSLHDALLKYMNLHDGNVNDENETGSDEINTESYATAAYQYLQYRAKIQQCPVAIRAMEKRQQEGKTHPVGVTPAASEEIPIENSSDVTLSMPNKQTEEPRATTDHQVEATSPVHVKSMPTKKRNYGSLFKTSTKKDNNKHTAIATSSTTTKNDNVNAEDTEDYWNAERAKLGLKKLK